MTTTHTAPAGHAPACDVEGCGCNGAPMIANRISFTCPNGCSLDDDLESHPMYDNAPELLAALEYCVTAINGATIYDGDQACHDSATKAIAAIARAKGR